MYRYMIFCIIGLALHYDSYEYIGIVCVRCRGSVRAARVASARRAVRHVAARVLAGGRVPAALALAHVHETGRELAPPEGARAPLVPPAAPAHTAAPERALRPPAADRHALCVTRTRTHHTRTLCRTYEPCISRDLEVADAFAPVRYCVNAYLSERLSDSVQRCA